MVSRLAKVVYQTYNFIGIHQMYLTRQVLHTQRRCIRYSACALPFFVIFLSFEIFMRYPTQCKQINNIVIVSLTLSCLQRQGRQFGLPRLRFSFIGSADKRRSLTQVK